VSASAKGEGVVVVEGVCEGVEVFLVVKTTVSRENDF
jgi:hypothetical protein